MSAKEEQRDYIFKRDYRSSMRLNYNHFLIKEVCGYLVHPSIPTNQTKLRIADVGTGTGIWACDLASKLPETVRIDGFDIPDAQYPAPGFRPKNVHLYVHDGFEEYPAEFLGQYDIVNARFWQCIVNDPDAKPLLKKLLSLPGGYLQWLEPLPLSANVVVTHEGAETIASERLANTFHKPSQTAVCWVEGLKSLFETEGLTDVSRTDYPFPNYLRPLWSQSSMATTADVMAKIDSYNTKGSGIGMKFVEDLERESANGVAVDTPFQCVVDAKLRNDFIFT
ncbi:uncharacterized protein EAF02_005704 [Botrytis sinoallii]|uniref:uncharacterized protein n=1 Tax=Botrytis sinoallii TaxID=1463999 RepID=UPI00190191B7|nr:uncharacterized protein EAF02_005704 [Botrytis sinoallii]KAF7882341.1 hypothetical protein EAF02_005704 [Botrytis sinoallii]